MLQMEMLAEKPFNNQSLSFPISQLSAVFEMQLMNLTKAPCSIAKIEIDAPAAKTKTPLH